MKLISKFRDYYDGCLSLGRDDEVLYIRHTQESNISPTDEPNIEFINIITLIRKLDTNCRLIKLGICGRWYNKILFQGTFPREYDTKLCGSTSELMQYLDQFYPDLYDRCTSISQRYFDRIDQWCQATCYDDELFIKHNTPIIIIDRLRFQMANKCTLIANPKLSDYGVASFIDPFTLFQDISVYLTNVLVNDDSSAMVRISDNDLRDGKGFNDVSFKHRVPSSKSRKRKKQLKRKQ